MSRALKLDSLRTGAERARARLFPPSKWARLFPSAAYRRSAPPPLGWGRRPSSANWDASAWGGRFCKAKSQSDFQITLACSASHETFRRVAVCIRQLTGNHTRPASREACCRAAVALRPSRISPERPARLRRAVRGPGTLSLVSRLGIWFRRGTFPACALRAEGRCRWTSRGGPACRRSPDSSCRPDWR